MITTNLDYRHSYSREFGWEITEKKPERYVLVYSVWVDGEPMSIKIEHSEPNTLYAVFSRSNEVDKWLSTGFFKDMKSAKKYIQEKYNGKNN